MNKHLSLLVVLILMAALPEVTLPACGKDAAPPKKITVYILAGQSNAVGYNHIREYHGDSSILQSHLREISGTLFWPGTNARHEVAGRWTGLRPGLSGISEEEGYRGGCFGPEIGFVMKFRELFPDSETAIIKFAEGATGIARSRDYNDYIPALKDFDDQGNNWSPPAGREPAGKLYTGLMANVKSALSALDSLGKDFEIGGFIWMQGEHEAGISPTMAGDYDKILSAFIRAVRKDLHQPNLPVLVGEINSHTWAFGDLARERQAAVCLSDSRSVLVKTVDLPRKGVGNLAHFDADGMLELGKRFGVAAGRFLTEEKR